MDPPEQDKPSRPVGATAVSATAKDLERKRLAEALRVNLRRRKAQKRGRLEPDPNHDDRTESDSFDQGT